MFIQSSFGQKVPTYQDSIATYFNEIKVEMGKQKQLWGKDLYGPMFFVDPDTRQMVANMPDSTGALKQAAEIYVGTLPTEVNVSNTSIDWNGRHWAMIMLPLPTNKQERLNLLAHELFHVSQLSLGFQLFNTENNHLDQKEGRIYLRLELEALKNAVQATNQKDRKMHLTNAFTFRAYRYLIYPEAKATENLLELNEGIAEYTGVVMGGRNRKQFTEHFVQSIDYFLKNPTFVRSFAYYTTPVYGYLLMSTKKYWNKEVTIKTSLTDYFIKAFNISLPVDLKKSTDLILKQYKGIEIIREEEIRAKRNEQQIADYKAKFIVQPHVELVFEKMNVSFDPRNIMPLEDKGTIYPTIRVSDNWGILTVKNGALMNPNWSKISISLPLLNENKNISGDGWTLELKDGYSLIKDQNTANYRLKKE